MTASLEISGVTVRFGGVTAVDDVSLRLEPGDIHGVVGPNGSGKTTLFNATTGFVPLAAGTIRIDGHDVSRESAEHRIHRGLARTFQTPRFDHTNTVLETILSGQRIAARGGLVSSMVPTRRTIRDGRKLHTTTEAVIERFDLRDVRDERLDVLSMGVVRMVEVARAAAMGVRYLLLDEPAAGLTAEEQDVLVAQLKFLAQDHHTGILLVEHNFALLQSLVSDITVLQQGGVIARGAPSTIAADRRVQEAYLGVPVSESSSNSRSAPREAAKPALEVRDLDVAYGGIEVCHKATLTLAEGEVLVLVGANGAGKSSLLNAIAGRTEDGRRFHGSVTLEGRELTHFAAARRTAGGLALVPEGRGNVFPALTVTENLWLANRVAPPARRREARERALATFPVLSGLLGRVAGSLSGGEQQMLALGMALSQAPSVILMDEPTQGLAPSIRLDIVESLLRLREADGPSVLLAEQDMGFASRLGDRILLMDSGQLSDLEIGDISDAASFAEMILTGRRARGSEA